MLPMMPVLPPLKLPDVALWATELLLNANGPEDVPAAWVGFMPLSLPIDAENAVPAACGTGSEPDGRLGPRPSRICVSNCCACRFVASARNTSSHCVRAAPGSLRKRYP